MSKEARLDIASTIAHDHCLVVVGHVRSLVTFENGITVRCVNCGWFETKCGLPDQVILTQMSIAHGAYLALAAQNKEK